MSLFKHLCAAPGVPKKARLRNNYLLTKSSAGHFQHCFVWLTALRLTSDGVNVDVEWEQTDCDVGKSKVGASEICVLCNISNCMVSFLKCWGSSELQSSWDCEITTCWGMVDLEGEDVGVELGHDSLTNKLASLWSTRLVSMTSR